jgi:peroxiredoxin
MALRYSNLNNLDSPIINFSLKGTDGKIHSLSEFNDKKVIVIAFICNQCPYVKAVAKRLSELQKKYESKGVQLIAINPNDPTIYPEDSFDKMVEFARKHDFTFPYLVDDTQEAAKKYDAICTPDIYVYDKDRKLKYRGRLDDNWKEEEKVVERDLEKAINHLLEGKEITFEQVPSMGCSIKWKN